MTRVVCTRCILDSDDDPSITFDAHGVCTQCQLYDAHARTRTADAEERVARFVEDARRAGRGGDYDCVVGLSGGVDSTYTALVVKRLGLRALAVHLDNGWDSEMAVGNIEGVVTKLGFDLYTWVINWEEFRDLQLAYFKAGVVDLEVPTDHAILAALFLVARRHRIRHIVTGDNRVTEGFLPAGWVHNKLDHRNLTAIHRRYGTAPLKTFPRLGLLRYLYYTSVVGIEVMPILDFVRYVRAEAEEAITREVGWREHRGKHFESIFTRFYQAHILPQKFGIDKRKSHFSTLINCGQMSRDEALARTRSAPYPTREMLHADREYVLKKLGFTDATWAEYLCRPRVPHEAYPSYLSWYRRARPVARLLRRVMRG